MTVTRAAPNSQLHLCYIVLQVADEGDAATPQPNVQVSQDGLCPALRLSAIIAGRDDTQQEDSQSQDIDRLIGIVSFKKKHVFARLFDF